MKFKVEIEDWLMNMMKEEIIDEWKMTPMRDDQGVPQLEDDDITGWIYAWLLKSIARDSKMFEIHIFNGNGLSVDVIKDE